MSHGRAHDYRVAQVMRVVDGDTVDLSIDVGFYLHAGLRFRLLGIDTPERGQPGAAEATAYTRRWLDNNLSLADVGVELRATTWRADSFGRWLADVYSFDTTTGIRVAGLSGDLIEHGHAVPRAKLEPRPLP